MYRFYHILQDPSSDTVIVTDKKQVNHLKNALRLKAGEKVCLFDGRGNEYISEVESVLPAKVSFRIRDKRLICASQCGLTIACAIPKKAKMDDIIDKLTQIGVDRIIPMETRHVIVKLDKGKKSERLLRWKKIALAASQQSQRNVIPQIDPVRNIDEVLLNERDYDLKLIPHLSGERASLREVIEKQNPKNILVFIGPEGDFHEKEIGLAMESGCIPVTLGRNVLRVDTAALAVASFIRLYADHS